MRYSKLDEYEKEILDALGKGKFKRIPNFEKEKKRYQAIARATLNKTKNINVRVVEKDLQKVKAQAAELGVPYQTLVSSLIHQYSAGKIKMLTTKNN